METALIEMFYRVSGAGYVRLETREEPNGEWLAWFGGPGVTSSYRGLGLTKDRAVAMLAEWVSNLYERRAV